MAQYIDKDALVAWAKETYLCENASAIRKVCYKQLVEHLDSLEVKEVDLNEQDIYSILYIERLVMREFGDKEYSNEEICQEVLKRFKAQKGE